MPAISPRKTLSTAILTLGCLVGTVPAVLAQAAQSAEKAPVPARSPRECLTSPRETLKTLYFAVVAYDLQPQLVEEAVACLDLNSALVEDGKAEAIRLAIELEQILRILCVPILGVPDKSPGDDVTLFAEGDIKIVLTRCPDGLWRFNSDTVRRIPAMLCAAQGRFRDLQAQRVGLVEECTDPCATMRRFLQDMFARDFYDAARCLDLSTIEREERGEKGPLLARQLAFVMQRRGWVYMQEVPNQPSGPSYTWYADKFGRIALERRRLEDGKEAWVFNKKTVRNIGAMYEAVKGLPPDPR
jgi:hypothetical protein